MAQITLYDYTNLQHLEQKLRDWSFEFKSGLHARKGNLHMMAGHFPVLKSAVCDLEVYCCCFDGSKAVIIDNILT